MINTESLTVRRINNWRPEVASLLRTLEKAGFALLSGHNGEEGFKYDGKRSAFISNLIACDESRLYVAYSKGGETKKRWLFLVLGNSPGELVCDYSISSYDAPNDGDRALEAVTTAHSDAWEGRKQPTCDCPHDLARINKQVNDAAILSEQ